MSLEKVSSRLIEPQGILETIYPIGSLYFNSTDSTNPATLLGFGTWEVYGEGKFILSAGDGYTAGSTGGVDSVTLTEAQLPSHSHGSGNLTTSNTGNHSHSGSTSNTGSHSHTQNARINYATTGTNPIGAARGNFSGDNTTGVQSSGAHSHNISTSNTGAHSHNIAGNTSNTGSGSSHTNMPPYIVTYVWTRTA